MNTGARLEGLTAGLVAGFLAILSLWLAIQPAEAKKPPKYPTLDPASAIRVEIEWGAVETIDAPHALFKHECCACGLTHFVLVIVTLDGLEMFWWVDDEGTRRARRRHGLPPDQTTPGAERPWPEDPRQ